MTDLNQCWFTRLCFDCLILIPNQMETKTYSRVKIVAVGWRTIGGGAWLALKAERRPEAGSVVEAPALLHFGGAGSLRAGVGHWGAPVVHRRRRLPVLDALTSRAGQPHPLLEAQLLAGGRNKRRRVRRHHGRWLKGDVFLVEQLGGSPWKIPLCGSTILGVMC